MKRDLDLIREILQRAEAANGAIDAKTVEEAYQIELMIDAGLVEGKVAKGCYGPPVLPTP